MCVCVCVCVCACEYICRTDKVNTLIGTYGVHQVLVARNIICLIYSFEDFFEQAGNIWCGLFCG